MNWKRLGYSFKWAVIVLVSLGALIATLYGVLSVIENHFHTMGIAILLVVLLIGVLTAAIYDMNGRSNG